MIVLLMNIFDGFCKPTKNHILLIVHSTGTQLVLYRVFRPLGHNRFDVEKTVAPLNHRNGIQRRFPRLDSLPK